MSQDFEPYRAVLVPRSILESEIKKKAEVMAIQYKSWLMMRKNQNYQGNELNPNPPLILLCVLESAKLLTRQLVIYLHELGIPAESRFVKSKSYDKSNVSNQAPQITWQDDPSNLKDQYIVVVEDMVDTGITLAKLMQIIKGYDPETLQLVVLLKKCKNALEIGITPDCILTILDVWVDGFGIDSGEMNRELLDLWCVIQNDLDKI